METKLTLKSDYIVEKKNILNEMRAVGWTLQELRFFAIYLSKINSRAESSRIVRFSLNEFGKIMEISRIQEKDIRPTINGLLKKIIYTPLENGRRGFSAFPLYQECKVEQNDGGNWFVEFDIHDKALPLMFDFKNHYFSYAIGNVLRLKGENQFRMYEILKQYEFIGSITYSLIDLKDLLGITPTQYPVWYDFKRRVLNDCQKALEENTDIKYTYEPIKRGRNVVAVKFSIKKVDKYKGQLTFDDFIETKDKVCECVIVPQIEENYDKNLDFLADACGREFNNAELQVLSDILINKIPFNSKKTIDKIDTEKYDYLESQYHIFLAQATQHDVKYRFKYFKKMLEENSA